MRQSKFNVSGDKTKRTYQGIVFDSEMEMNYYVDVVLKGLESGEILSCERQKRYVLQPKFTRSTGEKIRAVYYDADFFLVYADGRRQVIDVKGHAEKDAVLKRKMFWYAYPEIPYDWVTYSEKYFCGWGLYDELKRLRGLQKKKKKENKENVFEKTKKTGSFT